MNNGQSKLQSWLESICNVVIGYIIATLSNFYVINGIGITISWNQSAFIGFIFTIISLLRSYLLRRTFNWIHIRYG